MEWQQMTSTWWLMGQLYGWCTTDGAGGAAAQQEAAGAVEAAMQVRKGAPAVPRCGAGGRGCAVGDRRRHSSAGSFLGVASGPKWWCMPLQMWQLIWQARQQHKGIYQWQMMWLQCHMSLYSWQDVQ